MAMKNVQFKHDCSLKHLCIGTVRLKYDKETEEEGKQQSENGKK